MGDFTKYHNFIKVFSIMPRVEIVIVISLTFSFSCPLDFNIYFLINLTQHSFSISLSCVKPNFR